MSTTDAIDLAIADNYWAAVTCAPTEFRSTAAQRIATALGTQQLCWHAREADGGDRLFCQYFPESLSRWPAMRDQIETEFPHADLLYTLKFQAPKDSTANAADARRLLRHAASAMAMNHHYHHGAARIFDVTLSWGYADLDENQQLLTADTSFKQLIGEAYGALGTSLPFQINWSDSLARNGIAAEGLFFRINKAPEGFRVSARKDRRSHKLSAREWSIAAEVAQGKTYKEIGQTLDIAPSTATTHVYNLMTKLGLVRRSQLVGWFQDRSQSLRAQGNPAPAC